MKTLRLEEIIKDVNRICFSVVEPGVRKVVVKKYLDSVNIGDNQPKVGDHPDNTSVLGGK